MPRHSIATGFADYILPVEEMPARLVAYNARRGPSPIVPETRARNSTDDATVAEIFTHLRARTGHDFSSYKPATARRRLAHRLRVQGIDTLGEYSQFLCSQPDEPQALLKDLLISVTNFFRDRPAFEALERLIPTLTTGKGPDDQIRVWVAGCATGEEAYSIAMLLAEHTWGTPDAPETLVFATDIDSDALVSAREGFYTLTDAADVSPERLARFFVEESGGYRVRKELRALVLFACHNVIRDPPFSHLDLVSCRNLLIYLNTTVQRRLMDVLNYALDPGGYLFLGSSESIGASGDLFVAADKDARLFESRRVSRVVVPLPLEITAPGTRPSQRRRPAGAPRMDRLAADLRGLLERYVHRLIVDEHEILHLSPHAGRYLQFVGGRAVRTTCCDDPSELRLEGNGCPGRLARSRAAHGLCSVSGRTETVTITVVLRSVIPCARLLSVLFEEDAPATAPVTEAVEPVAGLSDAAVHLEQELGRLKEQLQSSVEQYEAQTEELKSSNEELQASNEELRSSAEELETGKEELQSVNEELTTVNQELKIKIEEQSQTTNDILNLVNSTEIGTLFVDAETRIKLSRRRSESVQPISSDLGRPRCLEQPRGSDLSNDLPPCSGFQAVEREVVTRAGRWYAMRLTPHRTSDNRVDGVVRRSCVTARKSTEQELRESVERLPWPRRRDYSRELDLIQTVPLHTVGRLCDSRSRLQPRRLPVSCTRTIATSPLPRSTGSSPQGPSRPSTSASSVPTEVARGRVSGREAPPSCSGTPADARLALSERCRTSPTANATKVRCRAHETTSRCECPSARESWPMRTPRLAWRSTSGAPAKTGSRTC
jgi:two-component system CheB/CheR fusion protein